MSRKVKFSKNWQKAKRRFQKIHTRIANARKDFLHKATTTISKNHAMVAIEDLQVRTMSKSSKGTTDELVAQIAGWAGHWWGHSDTGLNRVLRVKYLEELGTPRLT